MSERTEELLEELLAWSRLAYRKQFLDLLESVMPDGRHLRAYEVSDGTKSQAEVGKLAGLSQPTVSALWAKWRRLGIVRDDDGRACHLIRPSDVGVEIPEG